MAIRGEMPADVPGAPRTERIRPGTAGLNEKPGAGLDQVLWHPDPARRISARFDGSSDGAVLPCSYQPADALTFLGYCERSEAILFPPQEIAHVLRAGARRAGLPGRDADLAKGDTIGAASIQVPQSDDPTNPGTTGWPLGMLRCDIKAIIGGLPVLSETFPIHVGRAVTR
ncbi:MAG: hypothetical protein ACREFY_07285 [Acetobacteraceae bacterium]